MIPTDKFDVLNNYNHMIELALRGKDNFPDEVCNFIVKEFEFQAAVLFKVVNPGNLQVLGKSTTAKKNYLRGSEFSCSVCTLFKNTDDFAVNSDSTCELQISEFVVYESCVIFELAQGESTFLKVAKKTAFSPADSKSLRKIAEYLKYILINWSNARGGNTNLFEKPF